MHGSPTIHPPEPDVDIMVQRVEFLAAAPGQSKSGEPTVILTIRPDRDSFRPHNIALSRPQAARLMKSLRKVLRQSAGIVLVGFALVSAAGCSADVDLHLERIPPKNANTDARPGTEERTKIAAAVSLLDKTGKSPVEAPAPARTVEVIGNANFVLVVDGDLRVGESDHDDQSASAGEKWNTKVPWLTELRGVGIGVVGCYLAVVALVVAAIALMIGNLGRERGGPLLGIVAMLIGAAVLLQFLPHAESGLQVLPLPPWTYGGWLPFSISMIGWGAVFVAGYVAVSGCLDAPQVFAALCLAAMSLNGLLSFSENTDSPATSEAAACRQGNESFSASTNGERQCCG